MSYYKNRLRSGYAWIAFSTVFGVFALFALVASIIGHRGAGPIVLHSIAVVIHSANIYLRVMDIRLQKMIRRHIDELNGE